MTCFSPSWLCLTDSKPLRDCSKRKKVVKTDSSGIKLMTCNILSFQMTKRHSKLVLLLTFIIFLLSNNSIGIFIIVSRFSYLTMQLIQNLFLLIFKSTIQRTTMNYNIWIFYIFWIVIITRYSYCSILFTLVRSNCALRISTLWYDYQTKYVISST